MKYKFHTFFQGLSLVFLFLFAGCSNEATFPTVTLGIVSFPSPVAIASRTPTRMPTVISTATPQVTATLEPTMSPIPNEASELLIQSYRSDVGAFFVGENGSLLLKFPKAGNVQFSENPCNLYVFTIEWDKENVLHVGRYDLQGNLLGENTVTIDPQYYYGYKMLLSPDRNWVSFMDVTGDINAYDPRYSGKKDIFLVSIHQNGGTPQQISKNGGAPFDGAVWSPDGRYLGFSDLDDAGITQIYRWELQSRKIELLTSLDESFRELWVLQVQFSPDGQYFGFLGMKRKMQLDQPVLGIIRLSDLKLTWMDLVLPNQYLGSYLFWWNRASSQVMSLIEGGDPKG